MAAFRGKFDIESAPWKTDLLLSLLLSFLVTCITNLSAKLNYCDDGRRMKIAQSGGELCELCELLVYRSIDERFFEAEFK